MGFNSSVRSRFGCQVCLHGIIRDGICDEAAEATAEQQRPTRAAPIAGNVEGYELDIAFGGRADTCFATTLSIEERLPTSTW